MAARTKQWGLSEKSQLAKGVKNYGALSTENIADLYSTVGHLMSDEHRAYIERMLTGGSEVDALLDLEMTLRLVTLYATQAVKWSFENGTVTKDIGSILGEARQAAVAVETMRLKRNEAKVKSDDTDGMVDPTRESSVARFQNLHREPTE